MNEPVYTATAERVYSRLAAFRRAADRAQGTYPLKRYLSVMLDQLGHVMDTFDRIDYLTPDEPGADTRPLAIYTNLVTNPSYEDLTPLPEGTTNATAGRQPTSSWTDAGASAWGFTAAADGLFGGVISPEQVGVQPGAMRVSLDVWAVPGRTVRISARPLAATSDMDFLADLLDLDPWMLSGGSGSPPPIETDVPYDGPGYQRLEVVLLIPAGVVGVVLSAYVTGGVAGEQFLVDCLLAVQPDVGSVPYARYSGVLAGDTSDLANPDTADDAWLDWLGQFVGVRLPPELGHAARVDAVKYAPAGWQAATKAAIANAAKTALTGARYAAVFDHSTDTALGTASMWDVLIVTRLSETPDPAAVLAAVVAKGAKPAGVTLHTRTYQPTWAALEAAYPTWGAIAAAGSWVQIEEAGLS